MTKIIAEIGWNHMGDLKLAKKMILSAKKNGADLVKTQIFDPKTLKPGPWDHDGRRKIYDKAMLDSIKYKKLIEFAKKQKINFFTSIMNISGAKMVLKYQNNLIKIPSTENTNYALLKFCNKKFKKIIVSTGTATFKEIKKIGKIINKKKLVILHCTSSYPCLATDVNLPKIKLLKKYFKKVGFSDHSFGIEASVLGLSYNLEYVEKHFTINRKLPGRDNKFAILPSDLKNLKRFINFSKEANKFRGMNFLKSEKEVRNIYRGRWSV